MLACVSACVDDVAGYLEEYIGVAVVKVNAVVFYWRTTVRRDFHTNFVTMFLQKYREQL